MAAATRPSARERLAGMPDAVSVRQLSEALGVAVSTVRHWIETTPEWPEHTRKIGKEKFYPTAQVAALLDPDAAPAPSQDGHQGAASDAAPPGLDDASEAMLTLPQIAARTGRNPRSVSAYPSLYGPDAKDPFPPADDLGRRRERDVAAWFSRRGPRTGRRLPAAEPSGAAPAPVATDLIDVSGIVALTGREPEAIKSFVRRPEVAAASSGKVGNYRVWPRKPMIQMLREHGYLIDAAGIAAATELDATAVKELVSRPEIAALSTGKDGRKDLWPREVLLAVLREHGYPTAAPSADERRWRSSGPKTKSELAAHYGVTLSAITKRMERAAASSQPYRRPPAPVDPDAARPVFDPAAFDDFWRATA